MSEPGDLGRDVRVPAGGVGASELAANTGRLGRQTGALRGFVVGPPRERGRYSTIALPLSSSTRAEFRVAALRSGVGGSGAGPRGLDRRRRVSAYISVVAEVVAVVGFGGAVLLVPAGELLAAGVFGFAGVVEGDAPVEFGDPPRLVSGWPCRPPAFTPASQARRSGRA